MSAAVVILHLLGDIALLLWGLHMVHSGVVRAWGTDLRRILGHGLARRANALLAGIGVTALLQSSTATALMATSFTAGGIVGLAPALAVMLGANIGTALVVQVLSFDLSLAVPLLVLVGVIAFRRGGQTRAHDLGRVAIGLGLMLLSLQILDATVVPVAESASFREIVEIGTRDPLIAAIIAAAVAWAAHSSIAALVFIMSLAGAGVLSGEAILAMVAGANVGTALNPLVAAYGDPVRMRVPAGNLLNRLAGAIPVVCFAGPLADLLGAFVHGPERLAADGHLLFNIVTAVVFLPLVGPLARLIGFMLPDRQSDDPASPRYLDESALGTPVVALSNAARETLRMADVVQSMLTDARTALHRDNRKLVAAVSRTDDVVDELHRSINRYLAAIDGAALAPAEARRAAEILSFAINLEHIGDIIDKNLMELAAKRIRLHLSLQPETRAAIEDMHERLLEHLKLAVTVFLFGDRASAHRLVEAKDAFRDLERAALGRYFERVRAGGPADIETSGIEIDILRDLKRIEAHIAAIAYPLLERSGALRPTRLAGRQTPSPG